MSVDKKIREAMSGKKEPEGIYVTTFREGASPMNEVKQRALLTEEEAKSIRDIVRYGDPYPSADREALIAKRTAQAQLDKVWDMTQQDAIYWRGWLEQVMSEHLAEGISEKTKERVLEALKNNRF